MANIEFINKSRNWRPPELYTMTKVLLYNKKGSCLSLGPGAGVAELDLINKCWDVTAVDKEIHSYNIMRESTKSKKLTFIHKSFEELKLEDKYDYVIAINSLPFMDKKHLPNLFDDLINHSKKKCVYAMTFFGNNHTFVKKSCFGMTIASVKKLLKKYKLTLLYIDQKNLHRLDDVIFDVISVIASKDF
jgi:cyclopropane fatty-acyl-phospholipid synthase-like methyltransferase